MAATWPVGEHLVATRTARGLTQEELAERSGVSVDTISRLERGARTGFRSSTLQALAAALRVDMSVLLGIAPAGNPVPEEGADQLRRAVRALDLPDFAEPTEVLTLPQLHTAASRAWSDYLAGRHAELLAGLPALMVDTRRAVREHAEDHRAEAAGILATSYRLSAGLAGRLALNDLAMHAAHRALDTARHTTRPELDEAAALRYLAWVLVRQGDLEEAERVAVHAAERLDPGLARPEQDALGVFGSLLFNAASAAGRRGASGRADELLTVARAAAVRSGQDCTAEHGVFGPRVVALQAVDHAVRSGRPDDALALAATVPAPEGSVPAFWEAGHRIHLAAASADLSEYSDALDHLAAARRLAPEWVRVQPLGVAVMAHLAEHYPRRRVADFAALAEHYGVTAS